MTIYAATEWPSNAHLIADVHELGYIDGLVVDVTYGKGNFWTVYRPEGLVAHDLYTVDGVDFRKLPELDNSVDTLVFDPPYKLNGTPALGAMDVAYGVDRTSNRWQDTHELIADGIYEAARVLRPGGRLLLKCQNQVCSGKVRFQTDKFTAHAQGAGLVKIEQFEFLRKGRPQPAGTRQVHARRNHSTLMIFEKP